MGKSDHVTKAMTSPSLYLTVARGNQVTRVTIPCQLLLTGVHDSGAIHVSSMALADGVADSETLNEPLEGETETRIAWLTLSALFTCAIDSLIGRDNSCSASCIHRRGRRSPAPRAAMRRDSMRGWRHCASLFCCLARDYGHLEGHQFRL